MSNNVKQCSKQRSSCQTDMGLPALCYGSTAETCGNVRTWVDGEWEAKQRSFLGKTSKTS